jgi:hypothetical protein
MTGQATKMPGGPWADPAVRPKKAKPGQWTGLLYSTKTNQTYVMKRPVIRYWRSATLIGSRSA